MSVDTQDMVPLCWESLVREDDIRVLVSIMSAHYSLLSYIPPTCVESIYLFFIFEFFCKVF